MRGNMANLDAFGRGSLCHIVPSLAFTADADSFSSGLPTASLNGPLLLFLLFSSTELIFEGVMGAADTEVTGVAGNGEGTAVTDAAGEAGPEVEDKVCSRVLGGDDEDGDICDVSAAGEAGSVALLEAFEQTSFSCTVSGVSALSSSDSSSNCSPVYL